MKKKICSIAILPLISLNAFAAQDGNAVSWEDSDGTVYMECTGTVIGGRWVLTAAHCEDKASLGVDTFRNGKVSIKNVVNHPDYHPDLKRDIAVWELAAPVDVYSFNPLSIGNISEGAVVEFNGFGGSFPVLNAVSLEVGASVESAPYRLVTNDIGKGYAIPGDSGAAYYSNGKIVGVLRGIEGGIRLEGNSQFILNAVNAWNYPTRAETNGAGEVEITVQSLHSDTVVDNASTSGDATIVGGTCLGEQVEPFETCTYVVSSNGFEGQLKSDGLSVTLNKGKTKPIPPQPEPDGESSGGSFGWFSLACCAMLAWFRREKHA
ncbi:TPA: trypsin-like serine protease [Shewanella algae]|uniref:trypsin-like serine protease n=1 Tax=Shewanella TaxID=22 RepID=UPI001431A7DE|nr:MULTISPECIES: trypsin-like serine protease [Shewanella]NJI86948.1 S1 family peptidase [Shewanella sp. Iso12]HDS1208442.1 trypsin-like serine protease [Shewanella algae]